MDTDFLIHIRVPKQSKKWKIETYTRKKFFLEIQKPKEFFWKKIYN